MTFRAELQVFKRVKNSPPDFIKVKYEVGPGDLTLKLRKGQVALFILDKEQSLEDYYFMFSDLQVQSPANLPKIENILHPKIPAKKPN